MATLVADNVYIYIYMEIMTILIYTILESLIWDYGYSCIILFHKRE